jgi:hypothetical protein
LRVIRPRHLNKKTAEMGEGDGAVGLLPLLDAEDDASEGFGDAPRAFPAPDAPAPGAIARGPGRPAGAANRKTLQLQRLYAARGFKDPIAWMGELVTKPPLELLAWVKSQPGAGAVTLMEVIDLQRKVATDLAPYLHGKMPIRIDHGDERLPVLIIRGDVDQVTIRREREGRDAMSVGGPVIDAETAEISQNDDKVSQPQGRTEGQE